MVYGTYNELVTGAYKPTYNWGPHIAVMVDFPLGPPPPSGAGGGSGRHFFHADLLRGAARSGDKGGKSGINLGKPWEKPINQGIWLVVEPPTPLNNMKVSWDDDIPNI